MPIAQYDIDEFFSPEEIDGFKKKFSEKATTVPDRDPNQLFLDVQDVPELISYWYPKHVSKVMLRKAFQTTTTEEPNLCTFEEFVVLLIKATNARRRADRIDYNLYLDKYQLRELSKLFSRYSTNGTIPPEGLPVLFMDLGMPELDSATLDAIVMEVDADKSGLLEFDEFLSMWVVLSGMKKALNYREYLTKEQIDLYRKTFELTDQDGSGFIDTRELMNLFKRLGLNYSTEQVQEHLRISDQDQSGVLSFDEFCYLMIVIRSEKRKQVVNPETYNVQKMLDEGFTIEEIKKSGYPLSDLRGYFGVKRLAAEGGYTALEFRHASFSASELYQAGFGAFQLRRAGYSLTDLRNIGISNTMLNNISAHLSNKLLTDGPESTLPQVNQSGNDDVCMLPIHMTPRLRFHTDYKPKVSSKSGQ